MLKMKSRHVAGTITKKKKSEFSLTFVFVSFSLTDLEVGLGSYRDLWKLFSLFFKVWIKSKGFFFNQIHLHTHSFIRVWSIRVRSLACVIGFNPTCYFWIFCRCCTGSYQRYASLVGASFARRWWESSLLWFENDNARHCGVWVPKSKRIWCVDTRCFKASINICWKEQQKQNMLINYEHVL